MRLVQRRRRENDLGSRKDLSPLRNVARRFFVRLERHAVFSPMIATAGRYTIDSIHELGRFSIFIVRSLLSLWRLRALNAKIFRSIFEMGVRCTPIILTVGCFTGLVLGLQGYHTLSRFGSEFVLGSTVTIGL